METLTNQDYDYKRIQIAIEYIQGHFKSRPNLDEVAEIVHLSPFHFQRLFKKWAGVSPKQFVQFLSLNYAKSLLQKSGNTLFDTSLETGLSGTSRLHDLFIKIEGMTPGEYNNGGENLIINYSVKESPFGEILIASTPKGICHLSFIESEEEGLWSLKTLYPNAHFKNESTSLHAEVLKIFSNHPSQIGDIKLHLKGTPFQLKVWEALLKIPTANLSTYSEIAQKTGSPRATRAVGTAIGDNPVAYLIPCHRVIRNTGELGGYHWGIARKSAIIGWEAAKLNPEPAIMEN